MKQLNLVLMDQLVNVFLRPEFDEKKPFDVARLHNTRVWVNGIPVVLVVGEPDDETERLATGH